MTPGELLDALCKLLPPQFNMVIYHLGVRPAFLPGENEAPATRAIAIIRWAEQQERLPEVERIYRWVITIPRQEQGTESRDAKAAIILSHVDYLERTSREYACPLCGYTGIMRKPSTQQTSQQTPQEDRDAAIDFFVNIIFAILSLFFRLFEEKSRTMICPACNYKFNAR